MSVMKLDKEVSSSFGPEGTTFGPDGSTIASFFDSARFQNLSKCQAYFFCKQHDWKQYDFDGKPVQNAAWQPWLTPEAAPYLVPLSYRRPSDPYHLGRSIVNSFTDMLFGEGRAPIFQSPDDDTQYFVNELAKAQNLNLVMIEARNLGGATGSVALSWCFHEGKPVLKAHDTKFMFVHAWKDENDSIPSYVVEVSQYEKDVFIPKEGVIKRLLFWYRRDWTENADIFFHPVLVENGKAPEFQIDDEKSFQHDDGVCHVIWIKNTPSDQQDGNPDYEGVYAKLDTLDILSSIIAKGTVANLEPTMVIKTDLEIYRSLGGGSVSKGSDNAIAIDSKTNDDVKYLEIAGSSITLGNQVFKEKRAQCLEVTRCVIPDPDIIAAQGTSSVAMKMMYSRMIAVCDVYRTIYGNAIKRLLNDQTEIAKRYLELGKGLSLPEREETTEEIDPITREKTGNLVTTFKPCIPGKRINISLSWGPYFQPTQADTQAEAGALQQANGGKPLISHETSIELGAKLFGVDPQKEIERFKQQATEIGMYPTIGQELDDAASGKAEDFAFDTEQEPDLLNPG